MGQVLLVAAPDRMEYRRCRENFARKEKPGQL